MLHIVHSKLKLCANKPKFSLFAQFTQNFAQIMITFVRALPAMPATFRNSVPVFPVLGVLGVPQDDTSVDQGRREDQSLSREADVQEVGTILCRMFQTILKFPVCLDLTNQSQCRERQALLRQCPR